MTAVAETTTDAICNVSLLVRDAAAIRCNEPAIIEHATGKRMSFRELEDRIARTAGGFQKIGITKGTRVVLAVRPGMEFFVAVFALFRVGAVPVVVDPGMGRKNMLACIEEAEPEVLLGIPLAHLLSRLFPSAFRSVQTRITVGRRYLWGGVRLATLAKSEPAEPATTKADDLAAILFTSGATGIPKGVKYEHGMFVGQAEAIRDAYGIQAGEIDVPCFALFALFSVAMGVTVVIPEMDMSRPGECDPAKIFDAIQKHNATMSFGSPAVWRKVGPYLRDNDKRLPTLKRILIAGAPVPWQTLSLFEGRLAEDGDLHTPYGATESLPFSTISASQILGETKLKTMTGAGTCVGKPLAGVRAMIVETTDGPIASIDDAKELSTGEVGEIIVQSRVTTREYFNRPDNTTGAKIRDGEGFWHRMGDCGYFDDLGRIWFCGRVAHRVQTATGIMYPVRCEAIFNNHAAVEKSALVGVGEVGNQTPVIVIELHSGLPDAISRKRIREELMVMAGESELTRDIQHLLFHECLPVDVRHNAKINREALGKWASTRLSEARV